MTTYRFENADVHCPRVGCGARLVVDRRGERTWLFCPDCPYSEPVDAWDEPLPQRGEIREAGEQVQTMSESEQEALIRWRKGWGAW